MTRLTEEQITQKARELVKATLSPESHSRCDCRDEIDKGKWDKGQKVRVARAAIIATLTKYAPHLLPRDPGEETHMDDKERQLRAERAFKNAGLAEHYRGAAIIAARRALSELDMPAPRDPREDVADEIAKAWGNASLQPFALYVIKHLDKERGK